MRRQCEVVIRCSLCSRTSFGPLNRCSLSSSAGVSASDADDLEAHRYLLEQLGNRLGIKEMSDWYGISKKQIFASKGEQLYRFYPSLATALKMVYPTHPWQASLFTGSSVPPKGYWRNKKHILNVLNTAERHMGISKPEDWYSVTLADLRELGIPKALTKTRLADLLSEKYPDYKWEKVYLLRGRFAQQRRLEDVIHNLFPEENTLRNVRKEVGLIRPDTGEYMELDVYIPSLNLTFEYQERHHYVGADYTSLPLEEIRASDAIKVVMANAKGISLIVVPCWWDGQASSLTATIRTVRPDLLTHANIGKADPIPKEPPAKFFDRQSFNVEGIGEPITACFLTRTNTNPSHWWIFEKYDGIRGFWNPHKKAMLSRNSNQFVLPQDVLDALPADTFLDGELWFGRDNFEEAMKLPRKTDLSKVNWKQFKYVVFDIPHHPGTYAERYNALVKLFAENPCEFVEVAQKVECRDEKHLEEVFQDVVDKGGEGIILRDPNSLYVAGRSRGFLKHKKFRDAEALVMSQAGPHEWWCMLPNGVQFSAPAGTTEFSKRWLPKQGDIVSFKHRGFLDGTKKPKLPLLYRIRDDLKWDDVVYNWKEKRPVIAATPVRKGPRTDMKPRGYWKNAQNRQEYFRAYADKAGFDPLQPNNWENTTIASIVAAQGLGPLGNYKGNIRAALEDSFPGMKLSGTAASRKKGYWQDVRNCRAFFDNYAREKGFDYLDEETWENMDLQRLLAQEGGRAIQTQHGGFRKALQRAYPELQFSRWATKTGDKEALLA